MKKDILIFKKFMFAAFVSFLFVSCSDKEKIIKAYDSGNFIEAQNLCKPLAEKNDPDCLYLLGKMFVEGNGAVQNIEEGKEYLKKAADLGHRYAKLSYGMMALNGNFKLPEGEDASKYVYEAAKAGLPEAQLGYYTYIEGIHSKSQKKFRKSRKKKQMLFLNQPQIKEIKAPWKFWLFLIVFLYLPSLNVGS